MKATVITTLKTGVKVVRFEDESTRLVRFVSAKVVAGWNRKVETTWLECSIERTTDKAVLVNASVDTACGQRGAKIWLPKSQLGTQKGTWLQVAEWLLATKARELGFQNYGFITTEDQFLTA